MEEKRTVAVLVRLTKADRKTLKAACRKTGQSYSERLVALHRADIALSQRTEKWRERKRQRPLPFVVGAYSE